MREVFALATQQTETVAQASELAKVLSYFLQKLPYFFAGIILLILSFVVAKIAKSMVENKLADKGLDDEHKEVQVLAGRLVYSGVVIVGITAGLKLAGIDLTSIIAAAAFGIGFALKDIIVNFIAGIMILVGRDIAIGDFIKVKGQIGRIEAIQSRVTILKAVNGTKIVVPNSVLFKNKITNFTSNPLRRFDIVIPVDYRHNLENTIRIMLYSASITPHILQSPKPKVGFVDYGDKGFKLKLKAWCESRAGWLKVRTKLAHNLVEQFAKHNIKFPFTTYTINQYKEIDINDIPFDGQNLSLLNQSAPVYSNQEIVNQSGEFQLQNAPLAQIEQAVTEIPKEQGQVFQNFQNMPLEQVQPMQEGVANMPLEKVQPMQEGVLNMPLEQVQPMQEGVLNMPLEQVQPIQQGPQLVEQEFTQEELVAPTSVPLNVALSPVAIPVNSSENQIQ